MTIEEETALAVPENPTQEIGVHTEANDTLEHYAFIYRQRIKNIAINLAQERGHPIVTFQDIVDAETRLRQLPENTGIVRVAERNTTLEDVPLNRSDDRAPTPRPKDRGKRIRREAIGLIGDLLLVVGSVLMGSILS